MNELDIEIEWIEDKVVQVETNLQQQFFLQ
jgi:hypothetical protein